MQSGRGFILLGVLLLLAAGCRSEPRLSEQWIEIPETTGQYDRPSTVQLLVGYGEITSHAAVRVVDPQGALIMWDPGGTYGEDPEQDGVLLPGIARKGDVVTQGVPTLPEYTVYRYGLESRAKSMAVLEWQLTDSQTQALVQGLLEGSEGQGEVRTDYPGAMCGVAACAYFDETVPGLSVPKRFLLPSTLGDYLIATHPPDRVMFFGKNETEPIVYVLGE